MTLERKFLLWSAALLGALAFAACSHAQITDYDPNTGCYTYYDGKQPVIKTYCPMASSYIGSATNWVFNALPAPQVQVLSAPGITIQTNAHSWLMIPFPPLPDPAPMSVPLWLADDQSPYVVCRPFAGAQLFPRW